MRYPIPTALITIALLTLASGGTAQRKSSFKKEYWEKDPYSENDPAALERAGYVSFGPFPWGDDHGSTDIEAMFPETEMLFVETAHFKIGSSLPAYKVSNTNALERKLLGEELARLKEIFPSIKPRRLDLDPWLRLHLFAMRLEETYADFQKRLDVTDADFPATGGRRTVASPAPRGKAEAKDARYMGQGPYLGMRGKFLVLLMHKGGNLSRYAAKARGGMVATDSVEPQRYNFTEVGSLFFGTCCEAAEGSLFNDHAMRCHVIFNIVQSMIDGYKDYYFALPVWLREGTSHWYVRRIDPKEHCFTGMKDRTNKQRYDPDWDEKIYKRLRFDDFTPAEQLMKLMSFDDLTFGDHMAAWSRVDFLFSLPPEKFAHWMDLLKNPIPCPAGQAPTNEQILARQEEAMQTALDFDYAGFDAAWKKWAVATYKRR